MSPETYGLKTQVVNLIREAKRGGARLPWIRVIIGDQTSNHKDVLGFIFLFFIFVFLISYSLYL